MVSAPVCFFFKFLKKYKQHEHVLSTLPVAEQELSRLLNNAKIIRGSHHRTVLAKHYLKELWRLAVSLRHYLSQEGSEQLKSDLSDVHVVVEWQVAFVTRQKYIYIYILQISGLIL